MNDGIVDTIFIAGKGGEGMQKATQVEAEPGCGLRGDRYCERTGYWTGVDECQVTLIQSEDLEAIEQTTGIQVKNGEHRRNIVTRNIDLQNLEGKRFRIGTTVLEYDRPRPPCSYIQSITQPGMTRALLGRGGICARVVTGGLIKPGDKITVV
jgi:MOSC domain-containing protein YiiM